MEFLISQLTSQLGKHTVANIDLSLVGVIIAAHVVLNFLAKIVYGSERNTAAVMGGQASASGGDPKKQKLAESQTSPISQIVAYNLLAVGYASFCAVVGTMAWYDGTAAMVGGSVDERLYGRSEAFEKLGTLTASYEVYNVVAVSFLAEYRNFAFVGHHSITLVLAVLAALAVGLGRGVGHVVLVVLADRVVGQLRVQVGRVGGQRVRLRGEAREPLLEHVRAQRVERRDEHVHAQVELVVVERQRPVDVVLHQRLAVRRQVGHAHAQVDAAAARRVERLHDEHAAAAQRARPRLLLVAVAARQL